MRKFFVCFVCLFLIVAGCTPLEQTAYRTVVAANAFTKKMLEQHPECTPNSSLTLCVDLSKAVAAKNVLIDAVEVYCAGPDFDTGGACNAPKKGTSAAQQATAKLQAAISAYNQAASDLKGAVK